MPMTNVGTNTMIQRMVNSDGEPHLKNMADSNMNAGTPNNIKPNINPNILKAGSCFSFGSFCMFDLFS